MLILIPAYEPDLRLVTLIQALGTHLPAARVLVVDDGSGPDFDGVFDVAGAAGATVLRFTANRGKGAALKAGFAWAQKHAPGESVICADCDGQHSPTDIARVADTVTAGAMVLGGRRFTGDVPRRSKVGNTVSRWLFRLVTGTAVYDTQTGLRGYPADVVDWLTSVPGDRFEFEFNLLLQAKGAGVEVVEIPIETIYLEENASSHFRPVQDSLRIYAPLLKFAASSLTGYAIDVSAMMAFLALGLGLIPAVITARLISAAVNFWLNRDFVFRHEGDPRRAAVGYASLAAALLGANVALMALLVTWWGLPALGAKIAVEAVMFLVSYAVQHRAIFVPARTVSRGQVQPSLTHL